MIDKRNTVRAVAWSEIFPWLLLVRAFRLAISVRVLVLAAAALVFSSAGCRLVGYLFSGTDNPQLASWIEVDSAWPWDADFTAEPRWQRSSIAAWFSRHVPIVGAWIVDGPIYRSWRILVRPFWNAMDPSVGLVGLAYSLGCCLWTTLVWSLLGGAITRIAALSLARDESTSFSQSLRYARQKLFGYFFAPLVPMFGVFIFALMLSLLGLLMRFDLGVLIGGIVWPLVLIAGVLMTIIVLGLAVGWPLMWPTISTEGTDAFDALSRTYAYVFQRPLHYFFFILIASILGLLGLLVVDAFATSVIRLGESGVAWGMTSERAMRVFGHYPIFDRDPEGATFSAGAVMIQFWKGLVVTLQAGFMLGFFWSSATAMYLLLRRSVDAVELDEVALEDQQDTFGLPSLSTDAAGVAGVSDDEQPASKEDATDSADKNSADDAPGDATDDDKSSD